MNINVMGKKPRIDEISIQCLNDKEGNHRRRKLRKFSIEDTTSNRQTIGNKRTDIRNQIAKSREHPDD